MQPSNPQRGNRNPPQFSTTSNGLAVDVTLGRCLRLFGWILIGCSAIIALPFATAHAQQSAPLDVESPQAKARATEDAAKPAYTTERIRGRVLWLADALEKQYGISSVPEVAQHGFAILSKDGSLHPIVENVRGRAFRKDERLREMDLEIFARRHEQQPFLQILKLFEIDGERRYEVDYWCDVCAIVMFEKGPCACCQDDNRLRKRLVEDDGDPKGETD